MTGETTRIHLKKTSSSAYMYYNNLRLRVESGNSAVLVIPMEYATDWFLDVIRSGRLILHKVELELKKTQHEL